MRSLRPGRRRQALVSVTRSTPSRPWVRGRSAERRPRSARAWSAPWSRRGPAGRRAGRSPWPNRIARAAQRRACRRAVPNHVGLARAQRDAPEDLVHAEASSAGLTWSCGPTETPPERTTTSASSRAAAMACARGPLGVAHHADAQDLGARQRRQRGQRHPIGVVQLPVLQRAPRLDELVARGQDDDPGPARAAQNGPSGGTQTPSSAAPRRVPAGTTTAPRSRSSPGDAGGCPGRGRRRRSPSRPAAWRTRPARRRRRPRGPPRPSRCERHRRRPRRRSQGPRRAPHRPGAGGVRQGRSGPRSRPWRC